MPARVPRPTADRSNPNRGVCGVQPWWPARWQSGRRADGHGIEPTRNSHLRHFSFAGTSAPTGCGNSFTRCWAADAVATAATHHLRMATATEEQPDDRESHSFASCRQYTFAETSREQPSARVNSIDGGARSEGGFLCPSQRTRGRASREHNI